jgi:outer membrane protein OmpA-like peptidoglycan-associated protein
MPIRKKPAPVAPAPSYPGDRDRLIERRDFLCMTGTTVATLTLFGACGSGIGEGAGVETGIGKTAVIPAAPVPDNDADRILDIDDRCPNDPETYNGWEDDDGCPDRGQVELRTSGIVIVMGVYFPQRRFEVKPESKEVLDRVAETIAANPDIGEVLVIGSAAGNEGDQRAKLQLSEKRAVRAVEYLVGRGVPKEKLRILGLADACPTDPAATELAYEKNRRVTFAILNLKGEPTGVEIGCDEARRRGLIPEGL